MGGSEVIRVGREGQVVVPEWIRRELGLSEGTTLSATIQEDRLILEPQGEVLRRLRRRFANVPGTVSLGDELSADRAGVGRPQ